MAKLRKSLALFLAVVMVITATVSGIVLPAAAEGEATEPTTDVVYSENFEGDHGWTFGGNAIEATADGENKALHLSTASTKLSSPTISAMLKAGTDYMVKFKVKATIVDSGILDTLTIGLKPGSATALTSSLNLISQTNYKGGYYIVPDTEWVYMMGYFSVTAAAESLQVYFQLAKAGDDGSIPLLVDDVDVVEVTPETNLAVGGDFEEARPFWANDYYKNSYTTGTTTVTDDNTTLKVAMSTNNKATYFRMVGAPKKSILEISFRYKGRFSTNTYQNTTKLQTVTAFGSSSSTSWRYFRAYLFTKTHANTTGCNIFSCYPYNDVEIDDLCIRKVDVDVPESMTLYIDEEKSVDLDIAPSNDFGKAPTFTYTSDSDTVVSVSNGVVKGLAEGEATITVTDSNEYVLGTCTVTVKNRPTVTSIQVGDVTVQENGTVEATVSTIPSDAETPEIVWSTSNANVATIDNGVVTGVGIGKTTITATADGLEPVSSIVTVTPKNLIKNGDFESGTTAWAAGTAYISATGGIDNSGAHKLSYTHDGSANWQQSLRYGGTNLASLKPNTKYVLSFDYKSTGAGFARVSSWTTAIGDTAFTKSGWSKTLDDKSSWTHYTLTFTTLDADAIAAANKGYILYFEYVMYGDASGTGTGNFTLDNVALHTVPVTALGMELDESLKKATVGSKVTLTPKFIPDKAPAQDVVWQSADENIATVVDGVVTAVSAGVTTITATAEGFEPATVKIQVDANNLISNGDFEQGAATNWDNCKNVLEGIGKDGSWGLQSIRTSTDNDWAEGSGQYYKGTLLGKLKPSTKYILSFDYKNTGYGRGQLYVNYNFGTIGENTAWNSDHAYELPAGEIDWRTIIVTFTTPETITTNANWEFNPRSRGTVGVTYYDNFCLVEASTVNEGSVYTDIAVEEGEIAFAPAGASDEAETLKDVDAGTQVTVDVTAKEGYLMVPGSLKYVSSVTGQETKILNKELGFNPENFGSDAFSGDTFTFTMPEAGAKVTADFVPITEQNFAMDTVGTGLRVKGEEYDGIRFLTRMNMAFSFNEIAAQDDVALTVMYQGVEYTVKELGSMLVRTSDGLDADAMAPADAATYWKKSVAYTEGGDMTLLDYTNRYIDFTVVVTKGANVSAEDFEAREYSARGYMILEDAEGQLKTIVCDNVMTNSVNSAKGKVA